jgi:tellurite resistance protein
MKKPDACEALVYLMVVVSASDSDMTELELERIGDLARVSPVFDDFEPGRIFEAAKDCQKLLQEPQGLQGVLHIARNVIPERLHDTAYALAADIAAVDLEMRLEERRVLQLIRDNLAVDDATCTAIDRAAKARHRTLT